MQKGNLHPAYFFRDDVGLTGKTDIYTFYIEAPGLVSTRVDTATNSTTAGIWRHVCGVYRAKQCIGFAIVYKRNGGCHASKHHWLSTNLNAGSQPLQMEQETAISQQHGFIDDVRIYNRALSASEILLWRQVIRNRIRQNFFQNRI